MLLVKGSDSRIRVLPISFRGDVRVQRHCKTTYDRPLTPLCLVFSTEQKVLYPNAYSHGFYIDGVASNCLRNSKMQISHKIR